MTDYQTLYQQSLVQIQKQKQQIKKLEEQIRQRCQSYLIHSSRFKSKTQNSKQTNSGLNQSSKSQSSDLPELQIAQNTVNITLDSQTAKNSGLSEYINTQSIPEQDGKIEKTSSRPRNDTDPNQITNSSQYEENQLKSSEWFAQLQNLSRDQLISRVVQLKSKSLIAPSNTSYSNEVISPQKRIQQKQNSVDVNWQEVITGLKDRMSTIQKQKSQQTQKVLQLQEQIRNYKKQQKNWIEAMGSMKKKPNKTIQYRNSIQESQSKINKDENIPNSNGNSVITNNNVNLDQNAQNSIGKLWQSIGNQVDFSKYGSLEQKIQQTIIYIKQLQKKAQRVQSLQNLESSQVYEYNYSTPYRKVKEQQNKDSSQIRDEYESQQIGQLRKKCQQLQAQLRSITRVEHRRQDNGFEAKQNGQKEPEANQNLDQGEVVNEPPYMVQQQIEKPQHNSPYVKRSFVRKKIVKRNLSVMILSTPSKTKQERKASLTNQIQKLKSHLEKSKNGQNEKSISSITKKIQKLQNSIEGLPKPQQQIDQISNQSGSVARASGISQDNFTQIIQVETEGRGFKNYTAHILGLNRKGKSSHQK